MSDKPAETAPVAAPAAATTPVAPATSTTPVLPSVAAPATGVAQDDSSLTDRPVERLLEKREQDVQTEESSLASSEPSRPRLKTQRRKQKEEPAQGTQQQQKGAAASTQQPKGGKKGKGNWVTMPIEPPAYKPQSASSSGAKELRSQRQQSPAAASQAQPATRGPLNVKRRQQVVDAAAAQQGAQQQTSVASSTAPATSDASGAQEKPTEAGQQAHSEQAGAAAQATHPGRNARGTSAKRPVPRANATASTGNSAPRSYGTRTPYRQQNWQSNVDMDKLLSFLAARIEYYMSRDALLQYFPLRTQMDEEGCIPINALLQARVEIWNALLWADYPLPILVEAAQRVPQGIVEVVGGVCFKPLSFNFKDVLLPLEVRSAKELWSHLQAQQQQSTAAPIPAAAVATTTTTAAAPAEPAAAPATTQQQIDSTPPQTVNFPQKGDLVRERRLSAQST